MRIYYTHLCGKYQGRSWCGSSTSQLLVRATPQADAPTCFYDLYLSSLTPPYLADRCARYICIYDSFFLPSSIRYPSWDGIHTSTVSRTHTHTHKRDYHRTGPTSRIRLLHKQISHVYTRSCPITREQHVWFARFEFFESTRPGFAPRAQTTLDLGSHRTPRLAIWHACTHNTYACSYKVSRLQHNVFVHLHLLYMHGISRAHMPRTP
jgi:hypothetical protein